MVKINKKSQLTIFIIIAILIFIVLIALLFKKFDIRTIFSGKSPIEQIEKCIQDSIEENIEILSMQGGSISPEFYYLYEDNKVEYLCYTEQYYAKCVVQKPLLKKSIERELENYAKEEIRRCIEIVKSSLEKKGYEVVVKIFNTSVELIPENVLVECDSEIEITKEKSESYKNIKVDINSELYEMVMIATDIISSETKYGDFETLSQMINKPEFKIEKRIQSNETKIYTITSRDSKEKFRFASRSLAIPSGILGE